MTSITYLTLMLLGAYTVLMWWTAKRTAVGRRTSLAYNVAERDIPTRLGGPSLAATWVWATALFVSSMHAYTSGWVGLLWFTVPNALAVLLMIPFALAVRKRYPTGFTLSGLMRKKYGPGTQRLYHLMLGGLAVMATSVNFLAGGAVLSYLLDIPAWTGSILLALVVLIYTIGYGIRSSTGTGAVQMWFILAALAVVSIYAINATGWGAVASSMNGLNEVNSFFSEEGRMVALTFGIVTAAGLLAGPIGDPTFWQRAFSYRRGTIISSFTVAAGMFVLVPLLMGSLGFVALARGTTSEVPDYVNIAVMDEVAPQWMMVMFLFMILSALLSTCNAMMIGLSSLVSDYTGDIERQRLAVVGGLTLAALIACLPGNEILKMFLVYSTLRSAHFLITATTLLGAHWRSRAVFWGITLGLLVGFPATVYGNMIDSSWQWKLTALGLCSVLPILTVLAARALTGKRQDEGEATYQTPGESQALLESSKVTV